jgi:hypothetical protein
MTVPHTTATKLRPVTLRYLRRAAGMELSSPTDDERRHAIEVLREGPPPEGPDDRGGWFSPGHGRHGWTALRRHMHTEAQRIMDDCWAEL